LSKSLAYNALHYNCYCGAEAGKCTSELGIYEKKGDIKDQLYGIVKKVFDVLIIFKRVSQGFYFFHFDF